MTTATLPESVESWITYLLEHSAIPRKALEDFRGAVIDSGGSDF